MPKFIVTTDASPGLYIDAQFYKPGEEVEIASKDYHRFLATPRPGEPDKLIPRDREGADALGWPPEREIPQVLTAVEANPFDAWARYHANGAKWGV
jgi:hypothetical protein